MPLKLENADFTKHCIKNIFKKTEKRNNPRKREKKKFERKRRKTLRL